MQKSEEEKGVHAAENKKDRLRYMGDREGRIGKGEGVDGNNAIKRFLEEHRRIGAQSIPCSKVGYIPAENPRQRWMDNG